MEPRRCTPIELRPCRTGLGAGVSDQDTQATGAQAAITAIETADPQRQLMLKNASRVINLREQHGVPADMAALPEAQLIAGKELGPIHAPRKRGRESRTVDQLRHRLSGGQLMGRRHTRQQIDAISVAEIKIKAPVPGLGRCGDHGGADLNGCGR